MDSASVFDVARFAIFATFGVGVGFMLLTNLIAFFVLRPPKKLGFLWWHVTSISLSFICLGVVAVDEATTRIGEDLRWQSWVTLFGTTLYAIAQIIIFNVERQRLVHKRALDVQMAAQGRS